MAAELLKNQHHLYGLICRSFDNFKKVGEDNITRGVVQYRRNQLQRNWEKFQDNHEDLLAASLNSDQSGDVYFTSDLFSQGEETYLQTYATLYDRMKDFKRDDENSSLKAVRTGPTSSGQPRSLPKINLPRFSGQYNEWTSFRDLFQSIVCNNENLAPVEKLHYLKGSVSGEALRVIAGIPITDNGFARAWEKLSQRFENKRALINAQLDKLFAIKLLHQKSSQELGLLRSTVGEALEALEALGAEVDKWDYLLVYFVCRRLDAETHEAWEIHVGSSVEPPSYNQLDAFLDGRIRALETLNARYSSSKASPPATKPTPKPLPARVHTLQSSAVSSPACSCCGGHHYIASCPQFRAKTYEERRDLATDKRLCFNCLGLQRVRDCRSSKRCLTCKAQHHTTLHEPSTGSSVPSPRLPAT